MFERSLKTFLNNNDLSPAAAAELVTLLNRALTLGNRTAMGTIGQHLEPIRETLVPIGPDELPAPTEEPPPARYQDLGLLGVGGMGEVRRVLDRDLGRIMAMKLISTEAMRRPAAVARFVEEAQATAQLQHPGIVPVHEIGTLPDGRAYFTMKEVKGRDLSLVIAEVHAACSSNSWRPAPSGWTFRRLVNAFHRICQAVAFAHSKGVVHRDLKPANVMVGEHGEVLVVDWGLARVVGRAAPASSDPVITDRSRDGRDATQAGKVAGTPAYMPPEQARGELNALDERSDVYALGAILYELLSGRPPFEGTARAVIDQVLALSPRPLGEPTSGPTLDLLSFDDWAEEQPSLPLPVELIAACTKAMAREPERRYQTAADLASAILDWLDGARRRDMGLQVVATAELLAPRVSALLKEADQLRADAALMLQTVRPWEPEVAKAPGWAKLDEADRLQRRAELTEFEVEHTLKAALAHDPRLPEAHGALVVRYVKEHKAAEQARDEGGAQKAEAKIRLHTSSLPDGHVTKRHAATYLRGDGTLTLVTEPAGAEVLLYRYEVNNRRLVPVFQRSLGPTPLESIHLERGSYLCCIGQAGQAHTNYPVIVGRGDHWQGVRPGGKRPHAIVLPQRSDLGPHDRYVPAGWARSGGIDSSRLLPRRRLWVDGFIVQRFPVTNRDYLTFLNDLVLHDKIELALRCAPRERGGTQGELGQMIYGRDDDGMFVLRADADGDVWLPDFPVLMVNWECVTAYTRWLREGTGLPWRLPSELEWEKAARGVDGRTFPWGDTLDPSWCCIQQSHRGRRTPVVVDSFAVDESVYGVRGMGGNVRDWCSDLYSSDGTPTVDRIVAPLRVDNNLSHSRVDRGGSWGGPPGLARCAGRGQVQSGIRIANLGFRLIRSFP
ncbi:MAG: serine/threonine protein kinase/formylglycine-generating enzyme required for sulfatase activity [Kiritimatiellia bacterium]|jgi:serine/threonine protein kinase/formylglycine-generating enzyme required for sulfatase activity